MKELYISPELEILCFLPMQGIATVTPYDLPSANGKSVDNGLSTGEDFDSDYNEGVEGGDGDL